MYLTSDKAYQEGGKCYTGKMKGNLPPPFRNIFLGEREGKVWVKKEKMSGLLCHFWVLAQSWEGILFNGGGGNNAV